MRTWYTRLDFRDLACRTWNQIWEHELFTRASSIAFAAMAAAVPLLFLSLFLGLYLLPDLTGTGKPGIGNLTADQLQTLLQSFFPELVYKIVAQELAHLQANPPAAFISIALMIAVWTSSTVFVEIIDAINRIYGVKEIRPFWQRRLIGIAMAIIQSTVLLFSIGAVLIWPLIVSWIKPSPLVYWLISFLHLPAVFVVILFSYAFTFWMGPDSVQKRRWITPGAIFGAVSFLIASALFRHYVEHFAQYALWYGSLGGVMALMFWFWLISLVLLVSAEINRLVDDTNLD